jgi:hypothetical protein
MSTLNVDKVDPSTGTALELGTSGDTINIPSGVTIANAGTATGFGGISWQSVVTGSTMTAVAGNGYWIDTTLNACTITLPASASNGDEIMFTDYARNWGTNKITIDSNGLNYQGNSDIFTIEYSTDGITLDIVYVDATKGWIPTLDEAATFAPSPPTNSQGIFGFGHNNINYLSMTNLVSNAGVVATDVTAVVTARMAPAACEYGGDKGIFGYGSTGSYVSTSNLVSNTGVVATDTTGVGTGRYAPAACGYGYDRGIFGFGQSASGRVAITNLVSNTGVVSTDVTGVGSVRSMPAACEYGGDKGIFGYGFDGWPFLNVSNLVSNTGVVSTDVTGVGTGRYALAACGYGGDKGIFILGDMWPAPIYNLVSNTGVVATDTSSGVADIRNLAACEYGDDKGIFGYGVDPNWVNLSSTYLISNAGVIGSAVTGVGTARYDPGACSFN